ncbi:MAG TPA: hypothetical protein PKI80_13540, partial [Deltaproteobacteria bacterium]|nr:hypothetical protein [Deltaproteobacteria bacterium]
MSVPFYLHDFHPVFQSRRNGVGDVGGGDEEHLRQIIGHIQIVVREMGVLLRVKHLKQKNPNLIIGVGGCVASQEGEAIVARAPYVDLVFGP